eukprot:2834905-Prymnesium_polylepis.1
MMLPSYGRTMPVSAGTEPGTADSERKPIRPIMARRPLFTSLSRPLAFFSGDAFFDSLNGSNRLKGTGCGSASKVGK